MSELTTPSVVVSKIKFNNGVEYEFSKDDIIIFVGANNVGKSRVLKDIKNDIVDTGMKKVIVESVSYSTFNFNPIEMQSYFERNYTKNEYGNYNVEITESSSHQYDMDNINGVKPNDSSFYKVLYTFLSTESRLEMTRPFSYFENNLESFNIMRWLNDDEDKLNLLNQMLNQGFEKGIEVMDNFGRGNAAKKYKVAATEQIDMLIHESSRNKNALLQKCDDLHEQGDGIRSAFAILSSLIVNEHSLFLLDEPETFLHPPQARILGRNIVELAIGKQCFISTHNIDLIRGILEQGSERVKIIKINRHENTNDFYLLKNEDIVKIANDRNLKYTNILNGLFYQRIVLCENESDCKFYSTILEHDNPRMYQDTLFCAVGGKDQFKIIAPLLKRIHIDFVIIADIDLINDEDKLSQLVNSLSDDAYRTISQTHKNFLTKFKQNTNPKVLTQNELKNKICDILSNDDIFINDTNINRIRKLLKKVNNFDLLKSDGVEAIPNDECKNYYSEINAFLNSFGIYILECGEIESFITDVKKHGSKWVEEVFELYNDLDSEVYIKARKFIKNVFIYQ